MNWLTRFGAYLNPIQHNKALVRLLTQLTDTHVYNGRASNRRRLDNGLATADTKPVHHLVLSDGQGYHASPAGYWPTELRGRLAAAGVPIGGAGWVRANDGVGGWDSRVVRVGTWTNGSVLPAVRSVDPTAKLTFSSDLPGSIVQVAYLGTSAPFTVSVDGGAAVTVTPDGTASVGVWTAPTAPDANHTIAVQPAGTAEVAIVGFQVARPTGLRVHNLGGVGFQANTYANTLQPDRVGFATRALVPDPDVVHIALGPVEAVTNKPLATLMSELETLRGMWPNADVILHLPLQPDKTEAWWPQFALALFELADRWNATLVNMWGRAGNSYSLAMMANASYPNAFGSAVWGLLAANTINAPSVLPMLPTFTPRGFAGAVADDDELSIRASSRPVFVAHTVPGRSKRKAE